jgi:hypothetical protein
MYKWWWKLESGSEPWQNLMNKKYLRDGGVFYTKNMCEENGKQIETNRLDRRFGSARWIFP